MRREFIADPYPASVTIDPMRKISFIRGDEVRPSDRVRPRKSCISVGCIRAGVVIQDSVEIHRAILYSVSGKRTVVWT